MKKKQLEMMLERLEGFRRPSFQMEQYATPASVAAEMLFLAAMRGELGTVCDLGCGTGVLAIGAALLGARSIGVEIDSEALAIARRNAKRLSADVDFIRADVRSLLLTGIDTVVMNPPFGAQKASLGDRAFLSCAQKIAKTVYSLHNQGSEGFVRSFMKPCTVQEIYRIPFPLKRCFDFHGQDVKVIGVELYRITC
ncbi:MAG: 23S rRNA (uracil(747)-C(5))-methyltransferase [Methanosaeta sp. PtaU1.Bin112]|nr:MAG: 23S rRNA (uracil(747)-C(5))-methyltransferase [Methanosaeta sp. PtaU1.Bin112]